MTRSTNGRPVTMTVLNEKLDTLRRELRYLIVIAMVGGPAAGRIIGAQVASAARSVVGH